MKYVKSLAELVALTYAVTLLGLVTASGFDILDVSALKAAAASAIPAALSVLYGALAKLLGNPDSALVTDTRQGIDNRGAREGADYDSL